MRKKAQNNKMLLQSRMQIVAIVMCCLSGPTQSLAVMAWQPAPVKHKPGMSHNRMAPKTYQLTEYSGASVLLWKPDLRANRLELENDRLRLRPTGMDNYHAVVAKRKSDDLTEVAIRYLYMHGKPSGMSPQLLTSAVKASFEIIPAPLPREHRHYHAVHDAVFILRYESQPVSNTPVTLSTSNGTILHTTSDRTGAFRFTLPDDFAKVEPGRRNNKPAEFILHSEYSINGRNYRTSLSSPYHVDPAHWKSFELGVAVMAFGFVAGVVITRRNRKHSSATQGRNS